MRDPEKQKLLKEFLKKPRSINDVVTVFGLSRRTAIRRINEIDRVWRVSPIGERFTLYVYRPPWARAWESGKLRSQDQKKEGDGSICDCQI